MSFRVALPFALCFASACADSRSAPDAGIDAAPSDATVDAPGEPWGPDAGEEEILEAYFGAIDAELCRQAVLCESRGIPPPLGAATPAPRMRDQLMCHPAFERLLGDYEAVRRRALRHALALGRLRFDRDAARRCLLELPADAECDWFGFTELPELCASVFTAVQREGDVCSLAGTERRASYTIECAGGLRCVTGDACDGSCGPWPAEGTACDGFLSCGPEMFCAFVDHRCRRFRHVGESCEPDDRCLSGYCPAGRCVAYGGPGAECELGMAPCSYPLYCVAVAGGGSRCTEAEDVPEGHPCVTYPYDDCPPHLACFVASPVMFDGACRPPRGDREPCSPIEPCGQALRCLDGRCLPIALPTEACGPDRVCPLTHSCSAEGRCEPLPLLGQLCSDAGRCFHGICYDGYCQLASTGDECEGTDRAPLGSCEGYCSGEELGYCRDDLPEGTGCSEDDQCSPGLVCGIAPDEARRCIAWCGLHEEWAR